MIRPILSCSPNAATRLSRLSFTFFSNPEYVWMMYHCIALSLAASLTLEQAEHALHAIPDAAIHEQKKDPEKRHRGDHHHRRGDHVLAGRPSDQPQFHAHLVQELAHALEPAHQPVDGSCDCGGSPSSGLSALVIHLDRLKCHVACRSPVESRARSAGRCLEVAGEEGIEPPHPVLETGGLPLNLLPFTLRPRQRPKGLPSPRRSFVLPL